MIIEINDCAADQNGSMRTESRIATLFEQAGFPTHVKTVAVEPDLEHPDIPQMTAAGMLIDAIDALRPCPLGVAKGSTLDRISTLALSDRPIGISLHHNNVPKIILVNIAPRSDVPKEGRKNGTPFCYFTVGCNTLIISTVEGYTLSLVKKLGITEEIHLFRIPDFLQEFGKSIPTGVEEKAAFLTSLAHSQFRSFDVIPYVALWLYCGATIPSTALPIEKIPNIEPRVWFIDRFGNVKTTLTGTQIQTALEVKNPRVQTLLGELPYYPYLEAAPVGKPCIIQGRSGVGTHRFLEVVIKKGNAAKHFDLQVGQIVF